MDLEAGSDRWTCDICETMQVPGWDEDFGTIGLPAIQHIADNGRETVVCGDCEQKLTYAPDGTRLDPDEVEMVLNAVAHLDQQ